MKIIIYGFMACGKTTTGKILSKMLNFKFYDTDELISKKFKKSVYDFIKENGIRNFRKQEKKLMKELLVLNKNSVIAAGGGIFPIGIKNDEIIEFFLNVPYQTLKKRFKKARNTRPILKKLISKPKRLLDLYRKRLKFYKKARFKIKTNNSHHAAQKIMKIYESIVNKKHIKD